jgi:hypothetical protein
VVLGIHTPETKGEKDVERVKKKMKDAGLGFPIAIDNELTMWKRYSNTMWPAIYLLDKNGCARWGWAGELSWKGARGASHMRSRIEELLREK